MKLVLKGVPLLCVIFLLCLSLWLFATPLRAIFAHVPINYNEGWTAIHAARLMTGGPLYPSVSDGIFINYPPLSFYLVGALGRLMGDYIFAGRVVALVCMLIVALNIHLMARTLGANRLLSATAALIFLLFVQIYMSDYVAMNDPQWLGHGLQTTGLLLFLRRIDNLHLGTLVGVALLLLAGGLVKQSLFILPLSISLWIAVFDRRNLLRWISICVAALVVGGALALAAYGLSFIDQVLANQRTFTTDMLVYAWNNLALRFLPFLIFAGMAAVIKWKDRRTSLLAICLAIAVLFGVFLISVVGVNSNALFDIVIVMSVLSATFCQWCAKRLDNPGPSGKGLALTSALFVLPVLAVVPHAADNYQALSHDLDRQADWDRAISTLASTDGPVACETLALCYWAGRPSQIDYFNFGQYASLDRDAATPIMARLTGRQFAVIQQENPVGSFRLPKRLVDAISENYRPVLTDPTVLLTPVR